MKVGSLLLIILILSCSSSPRYNTSPIAGKYKDTKDTFYGISSHYGLNDGFDGNLTANGEIFDKDGIALNFCREIYFSSVSFVHVFEQSYKLFPLKIRV